MGASTAARGSYHGRYFRGRSVIFHGSNGSFNRSSFHGRRGSSFFPLIPCYFMGPEPSVTAVVVKASTRIRTLP